MESRSRAEAAGRAAASKGTQSGGGGRLYKDPESGLQTSYGAPVHTDQYGNQFAQGPDKWSATKDQVNSYNKAARSWNDELVQNNVLGWALPFGLQNVAPQLNQPSTYTGGTYHFGMNPAAAVGGVGGMFLGAPGMALGPVMGKGYSMLGGKNLVFSGPDQPKEWSSTGIDRLGNDAAESAAVGGQAQGGSPGGRAPMDRTAQSAQIPGPIQSPVPSIMQPQQQAPTPLAQQPVSIFARKPSVQSQFQVPGGNPYGFSIFGRAA